MIGENSELIMELWDRLKSHIPPKERLEVADILITVFDEYGMVEEELADEDIGKELRAAVRSKFSVDDIEDGDDFEEIDYND